MFHQEREDILQDGLDLAYGILTEHEDALRALADALVVTPTMLGNQVHDLLEAAGV